MLHGGTTFHNIRSYTLFHQHFLVTHICPSLTKTMVVRINNDYYSKQYDELLQDGQFDYKKILAFSHHSYPKVLDLLLVEDGYAQRNS